MRFHKSRLLPTAVISLLLAVAPASSYPLPIGIGLRLAKMFAQAAPADLERVLTQMDSAAKGLHSAEASLIADQYTKVVDETYTQKGKVYFQRHDKDVEMAVDFTEPDKQYVLYANGKAQLYNPKTDQVTEYKADKNRSKVEAFLLLGFGGGGHDLLATYDVQYQGRDTVNGASAEKLELVPKAKDLRNNIARIVMWVDAAKGVSIQQQMFFPGGDYRLAKYSDIQINPKKLPDNVFKLKRGP
jgi:outer membrane lipoprotein-sorting protein